MKRTPRGQHEPVGHAEFDLLLPAPAEPALSAGRHAQLKEHLMDEILTSRADAHAVGTPRPRPRRAAWIALPVAATLAVGALAVGPWDLGSGDGDGGVQALTGPHPEPPTVTLEPGTTENLAAAVDHIALAAARQPVLEPRKDQYIYIESQVSFRRSMKTGGEEESWVDPLHKRQIWLSPDGAKGWLYEPGDSFGEKKGQDLDDGPGRGSSHRHSYDAMKALPTDPDALLKKLYPDGAKPGDPEADWDAFKESGSMLHEQLAPPETSAALYKAAARIPGVTLVGKTTDAKGRPGIALAFVRGDSRFEWIFDKSTYAYLGQREVLLKETDGMKPGTVVGQTSVVTRAVVDAKKELPGGGKV
ncbi:CU044_5270 family protein [Streptomyces albireticuli]|uniref:CU044_5270 family protein n=1 Tax=Streptomyces albireticuli TaxID=1940 RepID=UPI0036B5916B